MKFKQWLSLPLAAALLAAAPALAAEKFRVGYLRVLDDAQAIVAQEGGFYKNAGLDSELIEFKSGTDQMCIRDRRRTGCAWCRTATSAP